MQPNKPIPAINQLTKKYENHIAEVYKNVMNGLMEPLEEEFRNAGCSSQTLRHICEIWFDKVKESKAVDNFLSPDLRRRGALSAVERAEAIAKRDMAVAQERMACSKFVLVANGPKTKPVITPKGTIVRIPNKIEKVENGLTVMKPEWTFTSDSENLDPNHLIPVSLKVPFRANQRREVRVRYFRLRLPAFLVQQDKLDSVINIHLVKQLSELPVSAANACLQISLQKLIMTHKYPPKPKILPVRQLDGSQDEFSDDFTEFLQTNTILKRFYGKEQACDSSSSNSPEEEDQDGNVRRISRKSKMYLKKLFDLYSDSSSESSTDKSEKSEKSEKSDDSETDDDNEESDEDDDDSDEQLKQKDDDKHSSGSEEPPKKKFKMKSSSSALKKIKKIKKLKNIATNHSDDYDQLDDDKIDQNRIEDDPLNSNDDISSSDSECEPENVCICLYNVVKRTKKNWRIELRGGVMNVSGEDYAFNTANITSKW